MDNGSLKSRWIEFIDRVLYLLGLARLGDTRHCLPTFDEIEDNERKVIEYETLLYELDTAMRQQGVSITIRYIPPRWEIYQDQADFSSWLFPNQWEPGEYASIPETPE